MGPPARPAARLPPPQRVPRRLPAAPAPTCPHASTCAPCTLAAGVRVCAPQRASRAPAGLHGAPRGVSPRGARMCALAHDALPRPAAMHPTAHHGTQGRPHVARAAKQAEPVPGFNSGASQSAAEGAGQSRSTRAAPSRRRPNAGSTHATGPAPAAPAVAAAAAAALAGLGSLGRRRRRRGRQRRRRRAQASPGI